MNPDKQRIAIAEACGNKPHTTGALGVPRWIMSDHEAGDIGDGVIYRDDLPDYLNDLNAMHEAEKILTPEYQPAKGESQWSDYLGWLGFCGENKTREVYECVTATAAQRAEAFLRTIGKWENDK